MTAIVVLEKAKAAGVALTVEGGELYARPRSALTQELRAIIQSCKLELIEALYPLGYTLDDLAEMDKLIREIAEAEDWPQEALEATLDERRRMRPVDVPDALQRLRKAQKWAVGRWPDTPAERTKIELLDGWQ